MLIEFSVGNYWSFKERKTLSMQAVGISEYPENVFGAGEKGKHRLLKSVVIYGANSSGKTNLLKAFGEMRHFVLNSVKGSSGDELYPVPYLTNIDTRQKPSFFEVVFLIGASRYRYGFEADKARVVSEWLYRADKEREYSLFERDYDKIEVGKRFAEGQKLEQRTRENALFLSVVDQFNGEEAGKILRWFDKAPSYSGLVHEQLRTITLDLMKDERKLLLLNNFAQELDLGFTDFRLEEMEFDEDEILNSEISEGRARAVFEMIAKYKKSKHFFIRAYHNLVDADGAKVSSIGFELRTQESAGTNKLFDIIGPIFNTLLSGGVFLIDELDAKLHPLITNALVRLFHEPETNPLNAQLVFATHDTNLLSYGKFRRDQIYFTEKQQAGSTDLYSLVEYKIDEQTVRKDRSFEKDYIQGRYGAIPYLGDFSKLIKLWPEAATGAS